MDAGFYFWTDSYTSFRNSIINLAVNCPETCQTILENVAKEQNFSQWDEAREWRLLASKSGAHHMHVAPWPDEFTDRLVLDIKNPPDNGKVDGLKMFMERCQTAYNNNTETTDVYINHFLADLYGKQAGNLIAFLLSKATPEVKQEVLNNYLDAGTQGLYANIELVVRKNSIWKRRGNNGYYVISTRQKGESKETPLKFTHQPSLVYYMLHLIDSYHHPLFKQTSTRRLRPIDLRRNELAFCRLYDELYHVDYERAKERYHALLYRNEPNGAVRAGRLKDVVYDIRKTLQAVFDNYDESYVPYTVSAHKHLSISPDLIVFDENAKVLLNSIPQGFISQ